MAWEIRGELTSRADIRASSVVFGGHLTIGGDS